MTPIYRNARIDDIPPIAHIVNDYAERGVMLHRSLADLYAHVRDFQVAEIDDRVVGVVGLRVMWSNLAEVYALAVALDGRGQGVGKSLVRAAMEDARRLGVPRVFALTYEKIFFERCGFRVVDRQDLPLKVWSECVRCPKRQACDEIAMLRVLEDVPAPPDPPAPSSAPSPQTPEQEYDVPTPITSVRVSASSGKNSPDMSGNPL